MTLPIDRSTLALAQGNQVPYQVAASAKNINFLTVVADTIDELNAKVNAHAASTLLPHNDESVSTAKIANLAVTTPKLADLSVTNAKVANATLDASKFIAGVLNNETANGLLIAALSAETRTLNLNLAHYGDFSSFGEGHDITSIVVAAMTDLANYDVVVSGWSLIKVSVFIPGGRWKITTKRVFDLSAYGISTVRGFNIYGAGFENTQITFDSNSAAADNYLIYNGDLYGYSEIKNIRFVAANLVEKCVYIATGASGNAQSLIFTNVTWYGFMESIHYGGTITASEMDYYSCKWINVPVGGYGIYMDNVNSVNHNLYACEMESISGHGIHVVKGGCINVFGGSWIADTGGILLVTTDTTGTGIGTYNNIFNFYGIRTEMNGTGKIFDIQSYVYLNFHDCNLAVERSGVGNSRGIFGDHLTAVTWTNCVNDYNYEHRFSNSGYTNGGCTAHFEHCRLLTELSSMFTQVGTGSNVAGKPLISSNNCWKSYSGTSQRTLMDVTLNKEVSNLNQNIRSHTVILRSGVDNGSGLPANAGATYVLPLNAIVKKIRIVHQVTVSFVGTCSYDVKDYLGTTTFVSLGLTAQNVEATAVSADLWYRIDTVAKQTITVTQAGTNVTQVGYIVVDYI